MYLDVEAVDAIGFGAAPNGQGIFFDMTAPDPRVIDDTGDGSGVDAASPTRLSHMTRLTNPADATQFFDAEILDGFGFIGPNGQGTFYEIPNDDNYQGDDPDSSAPFTRSGTVTTFADPDNPDNVLKVMSTDELTTNGPINDAPPARYGEVAFKFNDGDVLDTTASDPPPRNTDPNPYLKLLTGGGPWLGPNVLVKQGPLWKIKDVKWASTAQWGVLEFSATWIASGVGATGYADDPIMSGLPFGTTFSILSALKYPTATGATLSSATPYANDDDSSADEFATIVDQETVFFQPKHDAGWPFGGTCTNSTIDGLDIPGSPYSTPEAAALAWFTTYRDPGGALGPGTTATWADLVALGVETGDDPDLITHNEMVSVPSYNDTRRALIFLNLTAIKALISPATSFSFSVLTGPATSKQNYNWSLAFSTFNAKRKADLTYDAENNPTWVFDPVASATVNSEQNPETGLPEYETTFTVDLTTLDIDGSKS
jgi:hypothetical protein